MGENTEHYRAEWHEDKEHESRNVVFKALRESGITLADFELLFKNNQQFLCMVAARILKDDTLAEDLVQDFFIKFWELRERVNYRSFEAFAYQSVKNSCIDYLRRQSVSERRLSEISLAENDNQEDIPADDKRLRRVLQLIDTLPPERRKIFEMHAVEGLSYKEIAGRMDISVNTVKTQLRRAYGTLRGKVFTALLVSYFMRIL